MKHLRIVFLLTTLFIVNICLHAQTVNFRAPLDIDPNVKIGKLENGLTYYIRNNKKPENRVFLYLAINTGSTNENDDQQGLAHFTEHMAFNGTKNFKKNELIDVLEKMGIKFGAELNAHTAFNETVYKLQVPSDKSDLVDKGFLVLEDWAHNLSFDDAEIDKERGVITEEWRLGLGAEDRMSKIYLPILLKGSRYGERLPIGKIDIIKNFKHETLRQYYADWYRPDLMAVVVVGDIDVKAAEQKIKEHFAQMKNPAKERPSVDFDIPGNKEPLISITTDKEATNSNVQIFFKHNKEKETLINDYRTFLVNNLFTDMLNKRFQEIADKSDAPFIIGYSYYGDFLAKTKDAYTLTAAAKENQINKSLELLLKENERVRRFGFTQTELDRSKDEMQSMYQTMAKEADKTESSSFVREYVSNFLTGEPIPGMKNELKYLEAAFPTISLNEVNGLAKKFITQENIGIVVTAPLKDGVKVPTEAEVLNIVKSASTTDITAYVDKVSNVPLLETKPAGSKVVSAKENKEFGYTELTFANGVKAVLKSTDFKNDQILFSAYSPGGNSLFPDKDIMSAMFASTIVDESGIATFDKTELSKKLAGKIVSISPYISDIKEGFSGSVAPKDLETLLQLNYLYFKAPRKDTAAFNGFMSKIKSQLKYISSSPEMVYKDSTSKILSSNNPRVVFIPTQKQINSIDLDKIYAIYNDRFADASDFTYFFVGNFNIKEITPMLESYLGGLPAIKRNETWKNVEPKFPKGVTNVTIHKGIEPKSFVTIVMSDKFDWNYNNLLDFQVMMDILDIKLREKMREDKSGIYGLAAYAQQELYPEPKYTVTFKWGCSPDNVDSLSNIVFEEIARIQKEGPTKTDLDKVKENLSRDRETNIKKNEFWLSKLDRLYSENIALNSLKDYKKLVDAITIADIQNTAKKYLTGDHYVKVVLKPEDKK